ncbi:hypothetical protein Hanom_Chr05g00442871 [Helianthus anomalus]
MTKMYEMPQETYNIAVMDPKYYEDLFNFDKFKKEEKKLKVEVAAAAKKKKLVGMVVDDDLGGESEEEKVDRDEMPPGFMEWGLEEDVVYEAEDGEVVSLEYPEWF